MDKPATAPPPYENQPLHGQPAYGQPVCSQPVYGPPGHGLPGYGPPTYAPQPGPCTTVVVASFGPEPSRMTCPHCRALIDTATEQQFSSIGWLSVLLLIGSVCCCWIPFCIDSCYDVRHCCPNCRAHLGEYRRLN